MQNSTWRIVAAAADMEIAAGAMVLVKDLAGSTLIVEPATRPTTEGA